MRKFDQKNIYTDGIVTYWHTISIVFDRIERIGCADVSVRVCASDRLIQFVECVLTSYWRQFCIIAYNSMRRHKVRSDAYPIVKNVTGLIECIYIYIYWLGRCFELRANIWYSYMQHHFYFYRFVDGLIWCN